MSSHRAYFDTAEEARMAAAAAVARLTAEWEELTEEAGDQAASTAPVVSLRIEEVGSMPAAPGDDAGSATMVRLTAPDGRTEVARIAMPTEQSDVLLTKASGTVTFNRNTLGVDYTLMRVTARIAKSIQITTTAACSITTSHIVQDRFTGKKYTCAATAIASAGVWTVLVTETSAADLNNVTHGTVVEFLAPPAEVNPIARVNAMLGFSVTYLAELTDSSGRTYLCGETQTFAASSISLAADHYLDVRVVRDPDDTIDDDTSLAEGDELTWTTTPSGSAATTEIASVADFTIADGETISTASGGAGNTYSVTEDTSFGDHEAIEVPILSDERGPDYNLTVGAAIFYGADIGGVTTAIDAASYPEPYGSQVIGSAMEWTSRVYRATDGRWIADVYTLPLGS
jgi:hypothetical protein